MKTLLILGLILTSVVGYAQNISNKGREFWVGYGHHQQMEKGCTGPAPTEPNTMNMVLYLSAEAQAATVTVTIDSTGNPLLPPGAGGPWQQVYFVPAYSVVTTDILPKGTNTATAAACDVATNPNYDARLITDPPPAGTGGAGLFRKKGIHIESNVPITAYAHIYSAANSGATMLLPTNSWGYSYQTLNSNQNYGSPGCYNWIYIVADEDNTLVEITMPPNIKTRAQNVTGLTANAVRQITLMKGQIYQVVGSYLTSDVNGNSACNQAGDGYSLSGIKIRSLAPPGGECKPFGVFSGSSRTTNPISCGTGGGDNDNQQLFPRHAWGKKYLTTPFSGSSTPSSFATSIYKIAVSDPATQVRRNGTLLPGPPANGLFYTFESNAPEYIEADKPVMVSQFMTGGNCLGAGGLGDPEMVVVAPIEQSIKEVAFFRNNKTAISVNYVSLIVPTPGVPSLRINNSGVFTYTYPHPRLAGYTVVVQRWDANLPCAPALGQCIITCDSGFNAINYGLGSVESYAYSAGARINNLNYLTSMHNIPDTSNGGTNVHEFTGVGTPMTLSILIQYKPTTLLWKFSEMVPAGCWTSTPAIPGDYLMDPASTSTYLIDSPIINGTKYYRYKLPQEFVFNCAGTFEIPVEATSPGLDNCGSKEDFYVTVEVKEKPIIDYSYQHPTRCTKDTVYLVGPTAGLSGLQPMMLAQWKWLLPGGLTSSQKDTAIVLPPGNHTVQLVTVTEDGLVSDTVTKTIQVLPPPTTVLTAVPDIACLGQAITFTQTASYGDPSVAINNYHWDFGDGNTLNNLVTPQVHTYASANTYIAKAAVRVSGLCVSDTVTKTVIISPEAPITFTYPTGCLPATGLAQFNAPPTDLGGSPITSYSWDFGDPGSGANNTSTLQNPTHTYTTFGNYTVTLTVTNSTGCTGDVQVPLVFNVQPALAYTALAPVCANGGPVPVNGGSVTNGVPGTGTYSGTGIIDPVAGTFDPAVAGPGTHTITFTYVTTSTPACTETITRNIVVNAPTTPSAGTYAPVCLTAAPAPVTLAGTPAGGTFSGTGVTGNSFNPATAGAGTHTITYTYTDANGCTNTATTNIVVNALPVVNAGTYAPVCINAAPVALAGTPAGGTFTGTGVTGSTFNPATAGAGTHTITYTYTDANGCTNAGTTNIVVNALPVVNAGTYAPVCINAAAVTLAGTPAGGTFSGTGVTGNTFNPATAGAGTHTITYNYTDANGCSNSATTNIVVNALPVVNAGTYAPVCISAAPVALAGTPAGGTFTGTGVTGTTFSPATAGAGTHTITYSYTDANGCANTATANIVVNALPVVNAGTYAPVCINATPVALAGTPAGGTFSGTGVTGTSFNPATAGLGTHTITYTYTDANGCTNTATTNITVNALPVVNAGAYAPVCINAAAVTLAGTPAGGTFSGTGVTGTSFNPATAGAGTHTITYNYTDANGCSNTATTNIVVNALPVVNAGTYAPVCISAAPVALAGTPAGGTFTGTGVTGNSFNPATAGAGTHTITYSYTDANGCSNTATTNIVVNALPVVNAGTYAAVCADATPVSLAGTPAGGTFSGTGVTGNSFNPVTAGVGTHTLTYTYTDANGCTNTATTTITVNAIPVLNAGTYAPVCINAAAVTLAGTPAGGTFSGPGVTGTTFNPATAGAGTHTITYGGVAGCNNSSVTTTIVVNPLPVLNAGTYAPVCINAAPIVLAGTPAGGVFMGTGVGGNSFDPAAVGAGTHTITYHYTDANGCANMATTNIVVNALPVVNAGTYAPVCINAAAVTLAGTPAGGTFSGTGVTGNSFNPATAGAGAHTITYNYTDANGCSNSATTTITVNALPVVDAGNYNAVCLNGGSITLAGTPAGGTFSGPGVTGTTFNPLTAGVGTHNIAYVYTDANGCSNNDVTAITVNILPTVTAGTYAPVCIDAAPVALAGTPAGGTFSGTGVTGNTFNPATAGAGTHTITYSYAGANGCNNTATTTITVNALPVVSAGTYSPVCIDAAPVTLAGTPAGGTFTGTGVTGNSFNPATAGAGTFNIVYTYTNANGCTNTATTSITVNALPVVNAGAYAALCQEVSPITLAGTPAGGTFSGPGVTGNSFNPTTAGPGTHTITYTYTAGTGCDQSAQVAIQVHPRPQVNFTVDADICLNETATITPSVVSGVVSTWNWDLGMGSTPPVNNSNPFTVTYPTATPYNIQVTATSNMGCVSLPVSKPINVHPLPVVDFVVPTKICLPGGASFSNQSLVYEPSNNALTYDWTFGDGGTSTATNPSHTYAGAGSYNVTLTATSAFGCVNTSAPKVVDDFYEKPIALFFVAPNEICQGENIVFDNQSNDPNSPIQFWNWTFSDGSTAQGQNPNKQFTVTGDHTITLTVKNEAGCVSLPYSQNVKVHLQPVINAGRDFVVPQGTLIQFEATANSSSLAFDWSPPVGLSSAIALKPTLIATADQTYTLTATGDHGCTATDFLTVKILKPVTVPNVFSPNGDGIHDRWQIPNLADYPGCTVQIFNRYGQPVFVSSGYGTPWDGKYKGQDVPIGTYYYVIKLENGFKPITGSVTIIR